MDYRRMDVPAGSSNIEVIRSFIWPDTGDECMENLKFYGAMLNEAMTGLQGEWAVVDWGYGPPGKYGD